jgi:hypothetical protein
MMVGIGIWKTIFGSMEAFGLTAEIEFGAD